MRHWKKVLLVLLVLVLLVPVTLLVWVATTESGLRTTAGIVDRIGRIGPVTLQIRDVSGTLSGGARFGYVEVRHRNADVIASGISGRIALLPLVFRRIDVRDPRVARLEIYSHGQPRAPRPDKPMRFLAPLMRLDVENARVDHFGLRLPTGVRHVVTEIAGSMTMLPKDLYVREAQARVPALWTAIRADGHLRARTPIAFAGTVGVDHDPVQTPAWRITAEVDGDLDSLPLTVAIDAPFHARLEGTASTLSTGWRFQGKADLRDLDIAAFGGGDALGLISGALELDAAATGFSARGSLDPAGLGTGPLDVTFAGRYFARLLEIAEASLQHAPSGASVTTRGSIEMLDGGGQHIDLAGDWSRFQWPLAGPAAAFHSVRGTYTLVGNKPWQVSAVGTLEAGGLPPTQFDVLGTLEPERFFISGATLDGLRGQVMLTGEARWKPGESWRIEGQARGIDPAQIRPDLPGRLDFNFLANGAPFGDNAALAVSVSSLRGTLRNQPLSGRARVSRGAGAADWLFDGVDLRLGKTQLQLDGSIRPGARDLRFVVNAEDLSLVDPAARGQVSARGRFAGTTQAPLLQLKARGRGFEWRQLTLDSLDADIDLDLGAGQRTQGDLEMAGLRAGGREVQSASLKLGGTPGALQLGLAVAADPVKMDISATGARADGIWQGQIVSLRVRDDDDLDLHLDQPAAVMVSAGAASLETLCLVGEEARLCGGGRFDAAGWQASFEASQLPLVALTAGLTSDVSYYGTINIRASANGGPGRDPVGELRAQLMDAVLEHQLSNGRSERMSFGSGEVVAIARPDALDLDASLDAGSSGNLKAAMRADRTVGEWRDHPISGSLDMTTDGLGLLDIYIGGIDRASGRLTTKVNVAGTLGAPTVDGLLQLRGAQIDIFQVNLSLRDLTMDARFDTNQLELTGHSTLGGETMNFSGNLAWRNREPYGELKISGQNLLFADVPEATVHASPDLNFRIAGHRVDATGTVLLPTVRLEPADLTNAVLASSDEVMVGEPEVDPARRWTVVSDIRVELGNNVHLDAFGLTAQLGGALTVRGDEFGATRGQGELSITSGQYSAFGRRLDVTRGRLIFNNQLLSDPGVDLRAQKVYPDVTAGVNVRGTLRTQRISFFSEPSLPQWQIASLILAGGSLQTIQNSSARNAASSILFAQGGAMLVQAFGDQIGIQDVSLETDLNNESSLVLGRYLSPRLYISYGISLAESINTLRLRYTINDSWTLRIESGTAQSADIDYTIFRGGTPPPGRARDDKDKEGASPP
jgi:translocation and assembly module TamB